MWITTAVLNLFLQAGAQPIEDAVSRLNARVEVDPVTAFHDISGSSHRIRVGAGLPFMLVDGQLTVLSEPAIVRDGRLILPSEAVACLHRLFSPRDPAPEASAPKAAPKLVKAKKTGFRLVLDPGHGGMHTGGKSYAGKLFEKDVALDICKKLSEELEARGIEVILTRDADRHFAEDIHEDLQHRVDIAARQRADFFLSVHLNWSENKTARGFEVYVPRNSAHRGDCDKAAELIHAGMEKQLDTNDRGVKEAGFYVLRNAPCPSTLVELEFLSNPQGERDMMSMDHRKKVVNILCDAVVKYAHAKGY